MMKSQIIKIGFAKYICCFPNEQTQCRRQTQFFDKGAANSLLAAKKLRCMILHYPAMKSYKRTFVAAIHARNCSGVWCTLDFIDFISIPQKMIVLILCILRTKGCVCVYSAFFLIFFAFFRIFLAHEETCN